MLLQVGGDAECDSIILLNDIPVSSDSDLSVPKHQVLKLSVENLSIPSTPLTLELVLGGSTMNPGRDRGRR
jgi:hypothetical protein